MAATTSNLPSIFSPEQITQIRDNRAAGITPIQTEVHYPALYEGGSQYDVGLLPFMDQADYRNYNQGFWGLLGNGLGRLAGETVTDAVQGIYQTLALPSTLAYGQSILDTDPINLFFNDVHDYLQRNLPAYHKSDYQNVNFGRRLLRGDFWADDFVQGLAFMGAAALTAYAGAGALGGEAGISNVARTLGTRLGGSLEALTPEELAALREAGVKSKFGQYLVNNANKIGNFAEKGTFATLNRTLESTFEASQTYQQTRDAKYNALVKQGVDPVIAKAEAEKVGNHAAAKDFYWNYLALPADYFEAGLIFKGIHESEDAGKFLISALKDPSKYKQTLGKLLQSGLGDFAKGSIKGALWEGVYEENMQQAIQNWAQHKYVDGSKENAFNGVIGGMIKNFSDVQGGLNIGIGALQGALFGGAGKAISNTQNRQLAAGRANLIHQTLADINSSLLLPSAKSLFKKNEQGDIIHDENGDPQVDQDAVDQFKKELNSLNALERNKNISALRGDKIQYNLFKHLQIAQLALNYFNAGIGGELLSKLDEYSKMKPEDIQKLGISYLEEDNNGNSLSPVQIAAKYKGFVKELEGVYDHLENSLPRLEDDPREDRNHRGTIFLNAASQIALRNTVQEARLKRMQLEGEQQLAPDQTPSIEHRINNLVDQHDLIEDFINEKKDANTLDDSYEKKLRQTQKELVSQINDNKQLLDRDVEKGPTSVKAPESQKAALQKKDYFSALMNEMDASNSLYEAINDFHDYTNPKKWAVKKAELIAENERQIKEQEKQEYTAQKSSLDRAIGGIKATTDETNKASLTNALKQYEDLKKSVPFSHQPLEDAIQSVTQRIKAIDSQEKASQDAEAARKAQATTVTNEEEKKEEVPAQPEVVTTATLPDVINPNPLPEPEDKERVYSEPREERKKPLPQRDVSVAWSRDEVAIAGDPKKAGNKMSNGDIQIVPSKDTTVTSQEPILDNKLNVGDTLHVELELDNPAVKGQQLTEMNLPLIIKTAKGERILYYNTYKIIKGIVCLNNKHWDLLAKQQTGGQLSIAEQEDLDFFNKRLAKIKADRAVAWAQYKKSGKVQIQVKITGKTHGNTINQRDDLNGNPAYSNDFAPRLLTQVFDEFELAVFTKLVGEEGFTSDGVGIMQKKMTPGREYTPGATYAFVTAPATDPNSLFESRYPVRLLNSRLGQLEFGNQAINAIHQRLKFFKGDSVTPQEVDQILNDINQISYAQASGLGKNPERVNMIIDANNSDANGNWRPRISLKVNDNSYVIFFFRQTTGEKAAGDAVFTGYQFNSAKENLYDKKAFAQQFGIDQTMNADTIFQKLMANRFFNINIREFSNKAFKFNLLPNVEFSNYKKSLVDHGVVKTDMAKISYISGKSFNGFYNPEIQLSDFDEKKPTQKEVYSTVKTKKDEVADFNRLLEASAPTTFREGITTQDEAQEENLGKENIFVGAETTTTEVPEEEVKPETKEPTAQEQREKLKELRKKQEERKKQIKKNEDDKPC